jgi:hypothetical protein
VSADAAGEDDARERTVQCLAREIFHLHAGLTRYHLPDRDRRLGYGNPGFLPVVLEINIGIPAGVHRFRHFPGRNPSQERAGAGAEVAAGCLRLNAGTSVLAGLQPLTLIKTKELSANTTVDRFMINLLVCRYRSAQSK